MYSLYKNMKNYLILIALLLCRESKAQSDGFKTIDSIVSKNYSYFIYVARDSNSTNSKFIAAQSLLAKAKSEQNWEQVVAAYRTIMYQRDKKLLMRYADSLLAAAKKSGDKILIGEAYLTKGIIFYNRKELTKALDNYLLADAYISKTNDDYNIYKIKYSIGHTKYYLGFYDEAIALFKECLDYFKNENDRAYLNSLHSLGLCYNKINNFDACSYYNTLGLEQGRQLGNDELEAYFNHSEGINQYFKKNYKESIQKLNKVIPFIKDKNDFANEAVANFYLGKNYLALGQQKTAIPYFLKVDRAFAEHKYIRPDLRENYEFLIDFYTKQNNPELQLTYINTLLTVDSILNHNYKYLSRKIYREYDAKKLLQSKNELEASIKSKATLHYFLSILLVTIVSLLFIRHYRNKKNYRQKFEALINANHTITTPVINNAEELDINPELSAVILKNLEKFEKNKKYLNKEINLVKIAALLNTNTKYASKIIYKYRNKKTIEYISDLRIIHIVELLKSENKYRYYTNKALAEEVGFGSTQNFTKAFKNYTKISPTYFIEELKKTQ